MKKKSQRAGLVAESDEQPSNSGNRTHADHKKKYHKSAHHKSAPTRRGQRNRNRHYDRRLLVSVQLRPKDIPTARALLLEQIMTHGGPTEACVNAGVGRATFYDWLQEEDGQFRKAYNRARAIWRASMIGDVERAFGERAQIRDTLAGIVLLKHNTRRYREVNRLQLSGPDGGPIVTLDAKAELIARLEKMIERAEQKPKVITAGGSEVRELAGSGGSRGLKVIRADEGSGGSRGQRGVRRVRGV